MLFWPLSSDANACRRVQHRLREIGSLTSTVVINAGCPRTVRRAANEDAITAAVAWQPCRNSRDISRELRLPQLQLLEELLDDQLAPCHCQRNVYFSRRSTSTPAVSVTTRCPWFDHLTPCAIWRWCATNFTILYTFL